MHDQDIRSIRMILCNPLSGKVSELCIIGSNNSVYQFVIIFCDHVVNIDNLYARIFTCLKNCLSPCRIVRDIDQSVNSACDHIINLRRLLCGVVLGIKIDQFTSCFIACLLNTVKNSCKVFICQRIGRKADGVAATFFRFCHYCNTGNHR